MSKPRMGQRRSIVPHNFDDLGHAIAPGYRCKVTFGDTLTVILDREELMNWIGYLNDWDVDGV